MSTPVFVIHGVGARSRDAFTTQVTGLAEAAGLTDPRPVYWGDLGANYALIDATVPGAPEPDDGVRDDAAPAGSLDALSVQVALFLAGGGVAPVPVAAAVEVRDGTEPALAVPPIVVGAARARVQPGGTEVRAEPAPAPAVEDALAQAWPGTEWLRHVGDPVLQAAIGDAVAAPVADGDAEVRGSVTDFLRRRIADVDRLVGAAFGAAGGRLNSLLRTAALPDITRTAGDVIVYQRHRDTIAQCVRTAITDVDPALGGDEEHAIDVVAHSLGGVIALDMATATDDPLWIRHLVTFGSQPAFFHVCDPRGGALAEYKGERLRLPESIGAWTNLWEPLDPLAFLAARVFELHDGSGPTDHRVEHLVSSGLWTHSSYWDLPEVARVIAATLA